MTKSCAFAAFGLAALLARPAAAGLPTTLVPPVSYTDGAVAQARSECGVGDLCAAITLPDGDTMRIYNRGAARCGPFTLELITLFGEAVVLRSQVLTAQRPGNDRSCPRFANTYLTLDSGEIRMGVFLARDGALFVQFFSGER